MASEWKEWRVAEERLKADFGDAHHKFDVERMQPILKDYKRYLEKCHKLSIDKIEQVKKDMAYKASSDIEWQRINNRSERLLLRRIKLEEADFNMMRGLREIELRELSAKLNLDRKLAMVN